MLNVFKKIGKGISFLFKNHTILAVSLILVIVLTGIWTPIIMKITDDNNKIISSQQNGSEVSGSSVSDDNNQNSSDIALDSSSEQNYSSQNDSFFTGSEDEDDSQPENDSDFTSSEDEEDSQPEDDSSSSKVESSSSESSPTSSETKPNEVLNIICWGDSITQGAWVGENNYPNYLQSFLDSNYNVLNAGIPGESSFAISARQGAIDTFLANEIVIKANEEKVYLGKKGNTGLVTKDGKNIDIDNRGNIETIEVPANVVYIDGVKYRLSVNVEKGEFYIGPYENSDKEIVLKKGSKVEFNSSRVQQEAYCEIIHVGANDAFSGSEEDIKALVARYKAMTDRRKNNKYIVIIPYWAGDVFDKIFVDVFGDKAVNFREIAITTGLQRVGLTPSSLDEQDMQNGKVPASLRYKSSDAVHLSKHGYKLMALLVYERGKQLKYW